MSRLGNGAVVETQHPAESLNAFDLVGGQALAVWGTAAASA
jgi:hypothetical protein